MKINDLVVIPYTDAELNDFPSENDPGTFFDSVLVNESADNLFSTETNKLMLEQAEKAHAEGRKTLGTYQDRQNKLNKKLWVRIIEQSETTLNGLVMVD